MQTTQMRCPRCGVDNQCAISQGADIQQCWCQRQPFPTKPPLSPLPDNACLCQACADDLLRAQQLATPAQP
ncbi:cysteine-rich CWC family protein [Shewanella sp. NIFS-20-20]|uniref:cysteine-rich CWC family protein n=1 Tax=Shewanella sp. NIFS-20-20 TaxID=2853806 RepID=UPI001C47EACF|nr:cysteine-rich CWC family protein [Shewanella sp. NIFS-20-20]MBV7314248.1 cysteine-rich CWC family protein [Shewanella sp. NIFS-20-20]